MASYRDPRNPEAIVFPPLLRPRILIVAGLFLNFLAGIATVVTRASLGTLIVDWVILSGTTFLLLWLWPPTLVTDQSGLRSNGLVHGRQLCIAWEQFGSINLLNGGQTLEVRSLDGAASIRHTALHTDRERIVLQFRQHGVDCANLTS